MSDDFDLFMLASPLRMAAPPKDIAEIGTIAVEHMKVPIVQGTLKTLVLLTFEGPEMRHWILKGTPPAPIDDIVRSLAAQTGCDALAFVYPAPVPSNVVADRAFTIAVESKEGALDVMIVMRGQPGDPLSTFQLGRLGDVRPTRRWLGVPTDYSLQLYRKDAGVFGGPTEGEA